MAGETGATQNLPMQEAGGIVNEGVRALASREVLSIAQADILGVRERHRRRRLTVLLTLLLLPASFLWYRILDGRPFNPFALPTLGENAIYWAPGLAIILLLALVLLAPMLGQGRSPHMLYRPEQIDVGFEDVKGLESVVDEVVRTLNVFLGYATFQRELGGNPRRGLLFEGPPGTGKTHLAKAMARHAGVPFLFVAGPAFQSMWYGMTARRIRAYFKALKRTARREGGAIGFIEEIDAFATTRGGLDSATPVSRMSFLDRLGRGAEPTIASGTGGTVNELLIQLQSFDSPPPLQRFANKIKDWINLFFPLHRQLKKKPPPYHNVLVIAATNRGDSLDPALLRPGRFDRRLYFDLPSRAGRRELVDYFLDKKSHAAALDVEAKRDELAGLTFGYTPVMIEHLLDEALIWALRNGRDEMNWDDLMKAKMTEEIGLPHPVAYTPDERRLIATHEAGHAVAAYMVGEGRKLEVLSIIKRRQALGLLAHADVEERFTKTRLELEALLKISLGGMVSEEIFEGQSGTGPAGDLAHATQVASEMVGSLGMAGSLVSYRAVDAGVFDPGLVGRVIGNQETKDSVDRLLKRVKREVTTLLKRHSHLVLALRDALLDRDELLGDEILSVLEDAGGKTPRRRSGRGSGAQAASLTPSRARR